MTKDELEAIRARHADCEPERCEDVHLLLAELDRLYEDLPEPYCYHGVCYLAVCPRHSCDNDE